LEGKFVIVMGAARISGDPFSEKGVQIYWQGLEDR